MMACHQKLDLEPEEPALEILQKAERKGTLFHGSNDSYNLLRPMVYASKFYEYAMFFALMPVGTRYKEVHLSNGKLIFYASKANQKRMLEEGFVYILDSSKFAPLISQKAVLQFICKKMVKPIRIVRVTPQDFKPKIHDL